MTKTTLSLALVLVLSVLVFAGKPVTDPLDIALLGADVHSDTGDAYVHGVGGVHAVLPGTGNIVLDPDRNARGNQTPRSIVLEIPGYDSYDAYFTSINSVGYACSGAPLSKPARDLLVGECIQSELAVNQIAGTEWFLICGGEFTNLTNVHVACVDDDGQRCVEWDITSPSASNTVTCALFEYQGGKKGLTLTQVSGEFEMSFAAHVLHVGSP